jgi:glutamate dehydrogenase/leucine dehydrogenase
MATTALGFPETAGDTALFNFQAAVSRLNLDPRIAEILASACRATSFEIPIRCAAQAPQRYRAMRLVHNNARGPSVGSIFFGRYDRDLLLALAANTSWTAALASLPFGGSAGAIDCNNRSELRNDAIEESCRGYVTGCLDVIGEFEDVIQEREPTFADVMLDEFRERGRLSSAAVLGKSPARGGIGTIAKAVARGASLSLRDVLARNGRGPAGLRVSIVAGDGTAAAFVDEFAAMGCTVISSSDAVRTVATKSNAIEMQGGKQPGLSSDCDVLVVAGSPATLMGADVATVKARFIVEAAGLNVTQAAEDALKERNVAVIPDLVAGCGSLIAAHVEWSHNLDRKAVSDFDVYDEIARTVPDMVYRVCTHAQVQGLTLRQAAYDLAVSKVARVESLRHPAM